MPTPSWSVKFDDGAGHTCTINGPQSSEPDLIQQFVTDLTANHTRYVYQSTSNSLRQWKLHFDTLYAADKANLETFYLTYAVGPVNTFTYTHTDGNTYTARFIDTQLQWSRVNANIWSITFTLETTGVIS